MKENESKMAFICFFESGLFKELRAKKIKKTGSLSTRVSGCGESAHTSSARRWADRSA
jgi:hypothetical protein